MKLSFTIAAVACLVVACSADSYEYGARQGQLQPTQLLKSFKGFVNDFVRTNDVYRLEYNVGDSARFEERSESGEVTGTFAFVAPEGDEYEFRYEADNEGFRVEGESLPEAPEETDDVKAAREAFFEAYEKQLELVEDYEYDSDESSEDDDDEDSSEEESSEEESSEEDSSEEDSDESDEDEEDEEEGEEPQQSQYQRRQSSRRPSSRRQEQAPATDYFSIPYPYRSRS